MDNINGDILTDVDFDKLFEELIGEHSKPRKANDVHNNKTESILTDSEFEEIFDRIKNDA